MAELDSLAIGGRVIEEGWNQGQLAVIDELVDLGYLRGSTAQSVRTK